MVRICGIWERENSCSKWHICIETMNARQMNPNWSYETNRQYRDEITCRKNHQNTFVLLPLVKVPLAKPEVLIQILLLSECWSFFTPKDKQSFDIDAWHWGKYAWKEATTMLVGLHFVDVRFTYLWTSDSIPLGPLWILNFVDPPLGRDETE